MKNLRDQTVDLSVLIENQFPQFVREDAEKFIEFIKSYYESLELKNQPLDIAKNLIEYYNISHFRKDELVEKTKLSSDVAVVDTTISVADTTGFPERGYIKINNEIIYYRSKTNFAFENCVRGTSALVLSSIPLSEVLLESSIEDIHYSNDEVKNIAFDYTNEFLRRVKSEVANSIPENLVEELDISSFLSKIKSFYGSKGSLNSHKILFRILFNDKKFRFKLKPRGTGATVKIINFDGSVGNAQITATGSGYNDKLDANNNLSYPPIIEIFGSGQGQQTANKTAVIDVTSIVGGGIPLGSTIDTSYTGITISDAGSNYVGPIRGVIREADYGEEEIVISSNGSGVVESWDFNTGELTLINTVGFFTNNEELTSQTGEKANGFIKSFEIIAQDPEIEFPKDYLFRPSESNFRGKKLARLEIIEGSLEEDINGIISPPKLLSIVQDDDTVFGVKSVQIESGEILKVDNIGKPTYEIDIEINEDFDKIYLPASTQLTHPYTNTDTIVTVDDATGFPVTNGQIYIDDFIVEYKERTINQFIGCSTTSTGTKIVNTEVISYGRYRTRSEYSQSEYVEIGQERYFGNNLYKSNTKGLTASSGNPTHTSGVSKLGRIEWEYIGNSKVDYFVDCIVGDPEIGASGNQGELVIIVDSAKKLSIGQLAVGNGIAEGARIRTIVGKVVTLSLPNTSLVTGSVNFSRARGRIVGLVGEVTVESSGALYSNQKYEFDDKTFNDYEGIEYSSWNVNSNHTLDTDNDYIGVAGRYAYKNNVLNHVYTASSAIPRYQFDGSTYAKNRVLSNVFDNYTNAFTLDSLASPVSEDDLYVFRNAILQDSLTDYDIVNNIISFTDTPLTHETIYLRYFNTTSQATKLQFNIPSATNNSIVLTTASTIDLTTDHLFVFLNGVLQVSGYTYDDTSKTFTFTGETVSASDDIMVFWVQQAQQLDSITSTSSLTYTLQDGGSNYSSAVTKSVFVAINGVVQEPEVSYTISGSTLTFTEVNAGKTITVIDCGNALTSSTISTLDGINQDRNNYKLQKLLKRIPYPASILNQNILRTSKSLSPVDTSKSIGISVDGIQYQSIRGNRVLYGAVNTVTIADGGTYIVPYTSSNAFDKAGYPKAILKKNGMESSDITITESIFEIAAGIDKIDINKFETASLVNLQGFSTKPKIEVINNNPIVNTVQQNPSGFRDAVIDVEFKSGNVTNFKIVDKGFGYTESPTIRVIGGGKLGFWDIPFVNNSTGDIIVTISGPLISSKSASPKISLTTQLGSNYVYNPTVEINSGSGAVLQASVANGSVAAVQILSGGQNYFNLPTINLSGIGKDAVLKPVILNGSIVSVDIVNPGSGYTIPPVLTVNVNDNNGLIESTINTWTFNIANRFITGIDEFGGYVFDEQEGYNRKVVSFTSDTLTLEDVTNIVVGMEASSSELQPGTFVAAVDTASKVVSLSKGGLSQTTNSKLINALVTFTQGDDRIRGTLKVSEVLPSNFPKSRLKYQYLQMINTSKFETYYNITSSNHSKVVGWSYDGHPIYCKYGYSTALDKTSSIAEQTSSWKIIGTRTNGPSIVDYPLGSFIEDYEYVKGLGTLDEYNGRFCVTPEFPDGAYCYFMVDEFPHVIGIKYFSDPDVYNTCPNRDNDVIPSIFTRVNDSDNVQYPEEVKNVYKSILTSNSSSIGEVESVIIEKSGINYKVGDNLIFDNDNTAGSGAIAYVSSLDTPPILSYTVDSSNNQIEFEFTGNHLLSDSDIVEIEYKKNTTSTIVNLSAIGTIPTVINNKQVFPVTLESHKVYDLQFASATDFNLSFDILNFNPFFQRDSVITNSSVSIDPEKIPSIVYIHTPTSIFELKVEKAEIIGRYEVVESDQTKFRINSKATVIDIPQIDFSIRSRGATGPIKTVNVVRGGEGYQILPGISTVTSDSGTGAVLLANSKSIGRLNKINFVTFGDKFYGSRTVRNYLNLPITVRVKSNFEIESVDITNTGNGYKLNPSIKTNNSLTTALYNPTYSAGKLVDLEVIDGGSGFSETPTIEVFSQDGGSGAVIVPKLRRRSLTLKDTVSVKNKSADAKILACDARSSTIELLVTSGKFEVNDVILSSDGREYGTIVEVNSSRAYSKSNSYGNIPKSFLGTVGFISDDFQKVEDSIYYQDFSYSITNERNTTEWRSEVNENTHPSGFKLFGKHRIHSRKSLLGRSQNLVRSAVTFQTKIQSLLDLSVETPGCNKQILWFNSLPNPNPYQINDLIFSSQTENLARVIEVGENYIVVLLLTSDEIQINEYIVNIVNNVNVSIDLPYTSSTNKTLLSINGILQSPGTSYEVIGDNVTPNFAVFPADELSGKFLTNTFKVLQGSGVNNGNQINIFDAGDLYTVTNKNHLLVSINGVVQNHANYTLTNGGKTLLFSSTIQGDTTFILEQSSLQPLTITGSAGTAFDLGVTPSSDCQLLMFFVGVNQTHVLTDFTVSGSTITFPQTVDPSEIFGWYIDETVNCTDLTVTGLREDMVRGLNKICNQEKNVTLKIESNTAKKPKGFFELNKESLDGTLFLDGTTAYGINSRFKYSNPEFSSSHVEVINDISSQFNGALSTFNLKINQDDDYTPWDGENSLMVELNGNYISKDEYSVSGSQITFTTLTPASGIIVNIRDFKSSYLANDSTKKSAELDQFNVFNGVRTQFNTSDYGVPSTATNNTDIFHVKNGVLVRPDIHLNADESRSNIQLQTVSNNKITFTTAPILSDDIHMLSFGRYLLPSNYRNWVYDRNETFDGVRREFTLLHDNTNTNGKKCEELRNEEPSEESLVVVRNGVYQKPTTDYNLLLETDTYDINDGPSTHRIVFTTPTAPFATEDVFILFHEFVAANFADRTDELTQTSSTVLSYTTAIANHATKVPFMYVDGVYQDQNSYTWDGAANTLTFSGTNLPTVATDQLEFHAKTGDLRPAHVFGDILNAWLLVLQRNANTVKIATVNNTFTVNQRTGSTTITGTDVVNVPQRSGTITIASQFYLITLLNLNASVMHDDPANTFVAFGGVIQEPGVAYDHAGTATAASSGIGNGNTYDNMTIPMGVGYLAAIDLVQFAPGNTRQYMTNEINQPYDGTRTRFRVTLDGVKDNTYTGHEDLIVSKNNVVLQPDVDYHLTDVGGHATDSAKGCIDFTVAPIASDEIFTIMMHENEVITLTSNGGSNTIFNLSRTLANYEDEGLIIIQNDQVRLAEGKGYSFLSNSQIQLNVPTTSGTPFGILTKSGTVMDYINTPFNSTTLSFNMFLDDENFVPAEQYGGTDPHSENIIVVKNNVVLNPVSDYTLDGTIKSRVNFTTAPQSGDNIFISTHGVMDTLNNITATSATTYNLSTDISTTVNANTGAEGFGPGGMGGSSLTHNSGGSWTVANNSTVGWGGGNSSGASYFHIPNVFVIGRQYTVKFTVSGYTGSSNVGISVGTTGLNPTIIRTSNGITTTTFSPVNTDLLLFGRSTNTATLSVEITELNAAYYPDALIGRPKELENQLLVTSNGSILDPRTDYYVLGDTINFRGNVISSGNAIRIRDYYGERLDVKTESYSSQVSVGDTIQIPGESMSREVTAVHSPSVMEVTSPTGLTGPSGLSTTASVSGGSLTGITINNGGLGYPRNTKLKTYGIGTNASANILIDPINGNVVTSTTIDQEGWNLPNLSNASPNGFVLVPTYESAVVRSTLLDSNQVTFGTKLSGSITTTAELIGVTGTSMASGSDITITTSADSGSGAVFQPFVVDGKLTKVEIVNGGSGYQNALDPSLSLSVNNGGGTGAVLEPTLAGSGTITSITVVNEGVGYDSYRAFIGNECIEYTTKLSNELKGVTRGVVGTTAQTGATDDKVYFAN